MVAIRNAMRLFVIASNLRVVRDALLRLCRKQPPTIQPIEPTADTVPEAAIYVEEDDAEETFAAWEADRNEKLYQVQDCEQQGLNLLSKAALLRAAVKCDDRGETFIAEELREQAEAIGSKCITEVPSDTWDRPVLRVVAANDVPAQPGV
jgi:hypothetical protein